PKPTSATITIVEATSRLLRDAMRKGYQYKRAGVILSDIADYDGMQPDLFEYDPERYHRLRSLDDAVDRINRICGSDTVVIGARRNRSHDVEHHDSEHHSKTDPPHHSACPSTRWSDIISLNRLDDTVKQ
ncbi:MAG: DUF4113 domain-containing protein, partial [Duncaniella sp.]|nr:DUF4113 domain-containing protein [Duncaniella sp.]